MNSAAIARFLMVLFIGRGLSLTFFTFTFYFSQHPISEHAQQKLQENSDFFLWAYMILDSENPYANITNTAIFATHRHSPTVFPLSKTRWRIRKRDTPSLPHSQSLLLLRKLTKRAFPATRRPATPFCHCPKSADAF